VNLVLVISLPCSVSKPQVIFNCMPVVSYRDDLIAHIDVIIVLVYHIVLHWRVAKLAVNSAVTECN